MKLHIVLFEPEIPPNTGNVIRLSANTGATLHLIKPLGFEPDDKKLRRAGLDYHDWAQVQLHDNFEAFQKVVQPNRIWLCETGSDHHYSEVKFKENDALVFGPETRGLSKAFILQFPETQHISIPMLTNHRSLNLSNSVAIVVYEAWRQLGFI